MKKILLLSILFFPSFSLAYTSLTNIDAVGRIGTTPLVTGSSSVLTTLFNQAFYAMLAVAIALAIFMIIRGGYSYIMSADNSGAKGDAKNKIQAAFGGLLLALGAVLILQFINPKILEVEFDFPELKKGDQNKIDPTTAKSRAFLKAMISDGFQKGEGLTLAQDNNLLVFFGELSDQQILDTLKDQLSNEPDGYKGFLQSLYNQKFIYEEDMYMIDVRTNKKVLNPLARRGFLIDNIDSILNRFKSINNKLLPNEQRIFNEAEKEYLDKKHAPTLEQNILQDAIDRYNSETTN